MSGTGAVLACTDLDRTLIYSRRAAGDVPGADLACVEEYDGAPASFVTRTAAGLLAALDAASDWVPCTTRTTAQYRRVRLPLSADGPLGDPRRPRHALCLNGGVLLVDGVADPDWSAHVGEVVAASAPAARVGEELVRRSRELAGERDEPPVGPVRDAEGLFRYVVLDRARVPPAWVEDLAGWCEGHGWRTSLQGRKLYCLPVGLTKAAGAREVARRLSSSALIAAGDSLLDADLLDAADAAVRPAHGELADRGWARDHVTVTASGGAAAGEEIARWLLAAAHRAHLLPVVQRSPQP